MGGLVGQYRVDIAIAEARLVKAHVPADVAGEEDMLFGMLQLAPTAVAAQLLLILLAQGLSVNPVALSQRLDAYGRGVNLPLLKKERTPH